MIAALLPLLGSILEKIIPDPAAAADAKLKMLDMAQRGELAELQASTDLAKAQIATNEQDAKGNWWQAGWRPFVGWCCGLGFLWATIGQPVFAYVAAVKGWPAAPAIDTDVLMYTLGGMLGLGGLRTVERVKGKA